jgi:tetratricopeptide (TPR) repeat protein
MYLGILALLGCSRGLAQTAPSDATQPTAKKPAPTFRAAGIQGNIAPSGYSGGAREEDARQVASLVEGLQAANFAAELPDAAKLGCDRQAELLHAALAQPGSAKANLRLGLFYLKHDDPKLAVTSLSVARSLAPGDAAVARYLAVAEMEVGDYAAAGRLALRLLDANRLDEDRDDAAAHRIEGSVEAAAGHPEAALAEWKLAVALDPGANSVFSAGLSTMASGLFADAERILIAGTAAHLDSAKLWLARGMAESLKQDQTQAIESLERSAKLDPGDLLASTLLAAQADTAETSARILPVVQALAGAKPEEAVAHYDLALVLAKANPGATGAVAAKIESELRTAIGQQPGFAAAHFQLGVLHENAGDSGAATAEFAEAVRLEPEVAEWRYRLARAYSRAGQAGPAEREMEAFKRLKVRRDAGGDVSAKLLDGLPADALGVGPERCVAGPSR